MDGVTGSTEQELEHARWDAAMHVSMVRVNTCMTSRLPLVGQCKIGLLQDWLDSGTGESIDLFT